MQYICMYETRYILECAIQFLLQIAFKYVENIFF